MKVHLLFADRDADRDPAPRPGADDLVADLDLQPVFEVMMPARHLEDLCPSVLLHPLSDPDAIVWRQRVLSDAIADPVAMTTLFELAGEALDTQRSLWMFGGHTVSSQLSAALHGLTGLVPAMRRIREFASSHHATARSQGLRDLYLCLIEELDASYLDDMVALLAALRFPDGTMSRAWLDESGLLGRLELLEPPPGRKSWWARLGLTSPGRCRFTLAERDDAGAQALADMRDDAVYDVATTVIRAKDHVVDFFRQLRWEAGFYVGCLRLHEALGNSGVPVCWPVPDPDADVLSASGLRGLSLAVRSGEPPVPSDLAGPASRLSIVTGANQGGKTTFARSVGAAQLLLQAGMFVPADVYRAALAPGIHTHFRRSEDDALASGKLEEELVRMSRIVDRCRPGDLVIMNESFASTDEIEGTYIGSDIMDALLDHGVRLLVVTHFHRLARYYRDRPGTTFLLAERLDDGSRSHRIVPGTPVSTSHGLDIFAQVFGAEGEPEASAPTVAERDAG